MSRTRVLFVAENVTLAQVVRLVTLARSLDPTRHEVHFACAGFDELVFQGTDFVRHDIFTESPKRVLARAERGGRLYGTRVLARYVEDELALFARVRPRIVIGDLRLSLAVSAPHAGIPYAALINAYWSRDIERARFPVPDHPLMRLFGERFVERYFPEALPRVLAYLAAPVNTLRKRYGLPPLGDMIDVLLYGDRTIFPDIPELTPLRHPPVSHVFLGPVPWSPAVPAPAWWDAPRDEGPSAYVTLGSSGRVDRLPLVLDGLTRLSIPLMVSTAGRMSTSLLGDQVLAAPYLPGDEAARRARLVVCNGGSSTAYQALAQGRPVLGIASNLDQFLAMTAVRDAGAGILLRAGSLRADDVEAAARELIEEPSYREHAEALAVAFGSYDYASRFAEVVRALGA